MPTKKTKEKNDSEGKYLTEVHFEAKDASIEVHVEKDPRLMAQLDSFSDVSSEGGKLKVKFKKTRAIRFSDFFPISENGMVDNQKDWDIEHATVTLHPHDKISITKIVWKESHTDVVKDGDEVIETTVWKYSSQDAPNVEEGTWKALLKNGVE